MNNKIKMAAIALSEHFAIHEACKTTIIWSIQTGASNFLYIDVLMAAITVNRAYTDITTMLGVCWANVTDGGPTFHKR